MCRAVCQSLDFTRPSLSLHAAKQACHYCRTLFWSATLQEIVKLFTPGRTHLGSASYTDKLNPVLVGPKSLPFPRPPVMPSSQSSSTSMGSIYLRGTESLHDPQGAAFQNRGWILAYDIPGRMTNAIINTQAFSEAKFKSLAAHANLRRSLTLTDKETQGTSARSSVKAIVVGLAALPNDALEKQLRECNDIAFQYTGVDMSSKSSIPGQEGFPAGITLFVCNDRGLEDFPIVELPRQDLGPFVSAGVQRYNQNEARTASFDALTDIIDAVRRLRIAPPPEVVHGA